MKENLCIIYILLHDNCIAIVTALDEWVNSSTDNKKIIEPAARRVKVLRKTF